MSQEQKPFSVNDRRHFTPDGRPRGEESGGSEERPASAATASSGSGPEPSSPPAEMDFGSFLLSLGAQASLILSGEAGPEGEPGLAVAEVRSIVSVLEMLKDKTEGRRTPEEDRILEGLLYELRMGYLAKTRVGGA